MTFGPMNGHSASLGRRFLSTVCSGAPKAAKRSPILVQERKGNPCGCHGQQHCSWARMYDDDGVAQDGGHTYM